MASEHLPPDMEAPDHFVGRHVGPDEGEQARMLDELGLSSLEELIDRAVPESIRTHEPLRLPARERNRRRHPPPRSARRNEVFTSLIGMGYSDTVTPPVILRNVLEDPGWYTAYTPYQPEISQGRLEALLNFQTMVIDLTGMEIANASLLDEATAAAEAMAMFRRLNPNAGETFVVDADCHPQTIDVVRTRAEPIGVEVVVVDAGAGIAEAGVFGVLLQYPGGRAARARPAPGDRAAPRAGRARRRRQRPPRAGPVAAAGGRWAPMPSSGRRNVSGCRSASAARTRRSSQPGRAQALDAGPLVGVSVDPPADRRCGSHCRRVSSTSGGRRRPATSAPRRFCSR